jgi:dinuclear metal center YbgI/SA1388 family protein
MFMAFKYGISIVSAHTNLDVIQGGINDKLADLFGLENVEVLQPLNKGDVAFAGMGRIGDLSGPLHLSDLVVKVKKSLGNPRVGLVGHKNKTIRRVAVVGGSGGAMISVASERGADLLITGDVRHHDALKAWDLGLALIDAGHFHTEKTALKMFVNQLRERFKAVGWEVAIEFFSREKNPMRWD